MGGVAIMMRARAKRAFMDCTSISKSIVKARFYLRHKKLTVIQMYAPTRDAVDGEKDEFFYQLQGIVQAATKTTRLWWWVIWMPRCGTTTWTEKRCWHHEWQWRETLRLLQQREWTNGLVVTGTMFPHKEINKMTLRLPDGKTVNQIDHVMVNGRMRSYYGVPKKITNIIRYSYEGMTCRVVHWRQLTDAFKVRTGVSQGCLLLPFTFLLTIDWDMKTSTAQRRNGIQWTLWTQLEDFDFADILNNRYRKRRPELLQTPQHVWVLTSTRGRAKFWRSTRSEILPSR